MPYATRINDDVWERHKDLIQHLYIGEQRTLKGPNGVIEIMSSRQSFVASVSQYESQFRKWRVRKNLTRKKWRKIFRAVQDRLLQDKASTILIDGVALSDKKRERESARSEYCAFEGLSPGLPEGIEVLTPPGTEISPSLETGLTEEFPHFNPLFLYTSHEVFDKIVTKLFELTGKHAETIEHPYLDTIEKWYLAGNDQGVPSYHSLFSDLYKSAVRFTNKGLLLRSHVMIIICKILLDSLSVRIACDPRGYFIEMLIDAAKSDPRRYFIDIVAMHVVLVITGMDQVPTLPDEDLGSQDLAGSELCAPPSDAVLRDLSNLVQAQLTSLHGDPITEEDRHADSAPWTATWNAFDWESVGVMWEEWVAFGWDTFSRDVTECVASSDERA